MNDAFGNPQSIVVLGGTSDIARELVARLVASGRCRSAVLAGRDGDALLECSQHLQDRVTSVETVHFEAALDDAETTVVRCFEAIREPVDLLIMAVGELGNQQSDESDPARVAHMVTVNYTWPAAAMTAAANLFRQQGHGRMVVFSSVAGYRTRRSNFSMGRPRRVWTGSPSVWGRP